jgi:hypothetical protein
MGDYAGKVIAWTGVLAIAYVILKGSAGKYLSYLGV